MPVLTAGHVQILIVIILVIIVLYLWYRSNNHSHPKAPKVGAYRKGHGYQLLMASVPDTERYAPLRSLFEEIYDAYHNVGGLIGLKQAWRNDGTSELKYELYFSTGWDNFYARHLLVFPNSKFLRPANINLDRSSLISIDVVELTSPVRMRNVDHVNVYVSEGQVTAEYTCFPDGSTKLRGKSITNLDRKVLENPQEFGSLMKEINLESYVNDIIKFYDSPKQVGSLHPSKSIEVTDKGDYFGAYMLYPKKQGSLQFAHRFEYPDKVAGYIAKNLSDDDWLELGMYIKKSDKQLRPVRSAIYAIL